MTPNDFIKSYEAALATQNWKMVDPLMSEQVGVTFSTGAVHLGKKNVRKAFEHNFKVIKSEKYQIQNVVWLQKKENHAVYLFEYHWSGYINEKLVSGSGLGTSVIIKIDKKWVLLTEHLGKKST